MSVSYPAVADYTHLLDSLPGGVLLLAPDGTLVLLNAAAESLWGVPAATALNQTPAAVVPAVLPADLLEGLAEVTIAPTEIKKEYWLPSTAQWIAMHTAPATEGRVWVYWDNVTSLRQAQEEAKQERTSEHNTRQLITAIEEVANTGYYEADIATMRFQFSDGLFRLFGEEPHAFEPTLELIDARSHPDDADLVKQILEQAIHACKPYYYRRRILLPRSGEVRTVEVHGNVFCDQAGQPSKLMGLVQDITKRIQIEVETLRLKDELAQQATDSYRTLFNSIDEGFTLLEILFDAKGEVVDCRFLEVNQAFEQQTGWTHLTGRTMLEVLPNLDPLLLAQYGRVAQTGEAVRFDILLDALNHVWYNVYATRVGGTGSPRVAVVFDDITTRKLQEQHQAFLLLLNDALRPLQDPAAIQAAATRVLGEALQADRTLYADVQLEDATYVLIDNYVRDDTPKVLGHISIHAYGEASDLLRAGGMLIVENIHTDPRLSEEARMAFLAAGAVAVAACPVLKNGHWVAVLWVHHRQPRPWSAIDLAFIEETAERTRVAVERARIEEALRASEARLRVLVENLPGGAAFIVDRDLRYQLAAGEALHAAGLSAANFVGRTIAEVLTPDQLSYHEPYYKQALAGYPFMLEHEANGRMFVSRGMPLPTTTGEVSAVLVLSYDLTDRKRTEDALRLSEGRLRIALEAAELGTWDWDLTTNQVYWNDRHFTLFGLAPRPNPVTPADFEQHVHPDDRAEVMHLLRTAIDTGQVYRAEFRAITAQGAERWMSGYGHVTDVDTDGRTRRMSGVMLDVTERKHTEQQLQEFAASLERKVEQRTQDLQLSHDLLQSVYDTSLVGMAVMHAVRDAAGTIEDFIFISANQTLEQVTGHPEVVGKRYLQTFPGLIPRSLFQQMQQVVETGTPQQTEYSYAYQASERWFSSMYVKLDDGVVLTLLDITERKQAEAERDRQLTFLQQAETIARLGSWEYELATGAFRWSAGMYRLFDRPVGSPVAPTLYIDHAVDEDRSTAERLVHRVTQEPQDVEETLRQRVGQEIKTVRVRAVVVHDAQEKPERVLGVDLDISELHRLQADNLRLRLQQQQALFEAVQQAQETERKRIAEALHNGIGQLLYATKLRLDQLHAPGLRTEQDLQTARNEADQLLAEAIQQTRRLSHELVPMVLEEFGLVAALKDICQQLRSPHLHFHCVMQLEEARSPLRPALQLAIYRMAQELAQNVLKHAHGATEASLELEVIPGFVMLRVEDNGPGFTNTAVGNGLGLRSIRDRVALLGGTLDAGSYPQSGAYVRLRIPMAPLAGSLHI